MKSYCLLAVLLVVRISINAMTCDNRFLPLYPKVLYKDVEARGQLMLQPVYWEANRAILDIAQSGGENATDDTVAYGQLFGRYYQQVVAQAAQSQGIAIDPMQANFLWDMPGILRGRALGITYWQGISGPASWGFDFFLGQVNTALTFRPDRSSLIGLSQGELNEIFETNVALQNALGINSLSANNIGISDINLYFRLGMIEDYRFKMRHLDFGLQVGVMIPTAARALLDNPASISLGGNGHWGIFITGEGQFELKEGITAYAWLRVNKRFSAVEPLRLPTLEEPNGFGSAVGNMSVTPGVGVFANVGVELSRLRSGFGLYGAYTIAFQEDYSYFDRSTARLQPNFERAQDRSGWCAEYITATLCYDMRNDGRVRQFQPIMKLNVDIPVSFLIARRVAQTYGISLTIESTLW